MINSCCLILWVEDTNTVELFCQNQSFCLLKSSTNLSFIKNNPKANFQDFLIPPPINGYVVFKPLKSMTPYRNSVPLSLCSTWSCFSINLILTSKCRNKYHNLQILPPFLAWPHLKIFQNHHPHFPFHFHRYENPDKQLDMIPLF